MDFVISPTTKKHGAERGIFISCPHEKVLLVAHAPPDARNAYLTRPGIEPGTHDEGTLPLRGRFIANPVAHVFLSDYSRLRQTRLFPLKSRTIRVLRTVYKTAVY